MDVVAAPVTLAFQEWDIDGSGIDYTLSSHLDPQTERGTTTSAHLSSDLSGLSHD